MVLPATDQYDANTLTKDELTALLRGPAGSTVDIWVGGVLDKGHPRKVELERRSLPQPPLKQACPSPESRFLRSEAHMRARPSHANPFHLQ